MTEFVPGQEVRMPCAAARGGPLGESVVVEMPGSCFQTATGRAAVTVDWACANSQPVGA